MFDAGTRGAPSKRAAIVNLSRGGVCARGLLPVGPGASDEGALIRVALGFADGTPPVAADARVAWVEPPRRAADEACTFGLCFVDLANEDKARIAAAVAAREDAPVAPAASKEVRLRLDDGPTLRAQADSIDETGAIIGAELPWLRLGAEAEGELDGARFEGRIAWIGLDVTAAGVARLQLRLAFAAGTTIGKPERRDSTLPYFSTEAARAELPTGGAAPESDGVPWFEDRSRSAGALPLVATTETALAVRERKDSTSRGLALVRMGVRRRKRMALLRAAVVVLSLSALFLIARTFLRTTPAPEAPATIAAEAAPAEAVSAPEPAQPVHSPRKQPVAKQRSKHVATKRTSR